MNDEEQNLSGEEPTEPQPTAEPRPKRLLRSTEDRMIWGVAGGLGRYFDIDPIIFRIAFGVSILFGGLGLFTYAAFALFVPVGDGHEVQPAVFKRSRWPVIVAGIAVALIVLPVLAFLAVFVTATGHGVWAAVVVAILGVVLLATSLAGGARWLIIPAAVLAVAIGGTAAADIRFPSSIGEREYRPASASAIPEDGYGIGVGRLLVDLRNIDWGEDELVELDIDVGLGQADIVVPESVCVAADAHAGAGELQITGGRSDGVDVDSNVNLGTTARPLLMLNAEIDAGQLRVINDDDVDLGEHRSGRGIDDDYDRAQQRAAAEAACIAPEPSPTDSDRPAEPDRGGERR